MREAEGSFFTKVKQLPRLLKKKLNSLEFEDVLQQLPFHPMNHEGVKINNDAQIILVAVLLIAFSNFL